MNHVTFLDVSQWLGSDISQNQLIALLVDLANKEYNADQFKLDIQDFAKQTKE
jgi:hypothetical protein